MAATNLLFAEFLDDSGCFCLRIDSNGTVVLPFAYRSTDEIKTMQTESPTWVVLSTARCGLHEVELPWLSDRKARVALPYALEERLAQTISTLHFAFDKVHHQNNRYLVAVIDKAYLVDLMERFDEKGIHFDRITLDWFALKSEEVILTPSLMLVRAADFQGALSGELATAYLNGLPETYTVLRFTDSAPEYSAPSETLIEQSFYSWMAQRLQHQPFINLCQGELNRGSHEAGSSRFWMGACAILAGIWIFSMVAMNTINVIRLNHQINLVDEEIAQVYRQFFPGAQQIISPRFRISQLMNTGHAGQNATVLWRLLDKLDKAIDLKVLTISQWEYKSNQLSASLKGPDFSALEELSDRLKKEQIKVEQTQALSHDDHVTAVLELRL